MGCGECCAEPAAGTSNWLPGGRRPLHHPPLACFPPDLLRDPPPCTPSAPHARTQLAPWRPRARPRPRAPRRRPRRRRRCGEGVGRSGAAAIMARVWARVFSASLPPAPPVLGAGRAWQPRPRPRPLCRRPCRWGSTAPGSRRRLPALLAVTWAGRALGGRPTAWGPPACPTSAAPSTVADVDCLNPAFEHAPPRFTSFLALLAPSTQCPRPGVKMGSLWPRRLHLPCACLPASPDVSRRPATPAGEGPQRAQAPPLRLHVLRCRQAEGGACGVAAGQARAGRGPASVCFAVHRTALCGLSCGPCPHPARATSLQGARVLAAAHPLPAVHPHLAPPCSSRTSSPR